MNKSNSCIVLSQMTNHVGKAMFAKAGELGAPVGFICMKVLKYVLSNYDFAIISSMLDFVHAQKN